MVTRGIPYILSILCTLLLIFSLRVQATENSSQNTTVTISTHAEQALINDEAVVRFHVSAKGNQPKDLQRQVNSMSQIISQRLAHEQGLHLTTANRFMQAMQHNDRQQHQRIDSWQLVQSSLVITSKLAAIPQWLEAIEQAGAHLDSLSLRLSDVHRDRANDQLLQQAISRFRHKATIIARSLGFEAFTIIRLHTIMAPQSPRPIMQRVEMMSQPSLTTIDRGLSSLTVNISGTIELPSRSFSLTNKP